uniref:Uncharacterized protein n=1 Tax=Myotis myotis TaxID=51298 RepID=A0A7J8AM71_MYOMY|nr:hypothetical protein mMyoMyo1_007878 [Myotis myotis]
MIASPTIPSVYFVQIPDKKTQLKEVHSWRCWEDSWVSEDDLKYAGEVVYLCVLNIE